MKQPQLTMEDFEQRFAGRHRLGDAVEYWAARRPQQAALIAGETGRTVTWAEFDRLTAALAQQLEQMGLRRGDFVVTLLTMSVDHVLLEYACFRLGAMVAPLDLRLSGEEIFRALDLLKPRGFFALGVRKPLDLRALWAGVRESCPQATVRIAVASEEPMEGAVAYESLLADAELAARAPGAIAGPAEPVQETDGALVIFTTGSTGSPKPALLTHRNITAQNMALGEVFFDGDAGIRALVNLPASHVGGQSEILMTTLFGGGTAVLVEIFDAARSLRAIAQHRVQLLGQIPVMFNLEWMLKDYASYDLSSLKYAVYGGNAVSAAFLKRLAGMAPWVGTGLGLTESSGFCTYVVAGAGEFAQLEGSLGYASPAYPCTVREPMQADGLAGAELPEGEVGHVCFHGAQNFSGYVGDAESTARTLSSDGILYTGDLGSMRQGSLRLTGRAKWVIKSNGYQIFPGDIEAHVARLEQQVASCVVVGVEHAVAGEAPVAVVEPRAGVELTVQELDRHARGLAGYMRPRHWMVLAPGEMPLNRVVKPDTPRVLAMAREAIEELRQRGQWDAGYR